MRTTGPHWKAPVVDEEGNQSSMNERIKVFFRNLPSTPQRWMAKYLRKRGWVCFYLEKQYRKCDPQCCWLELSENSDDKWNRNDP